MDLLQVKKDKIVDAAGKEVYLRGTCVGGWMNMEDFIDAYPGTELRLRRLMADEIGASKAELFFNSLLDNFFNEEDIIFIRSTGANCVRLPLNYRHFEKDDNPFVYLEQGFERLEKVVKACEDHGLYVILDMHAIQGWQNNHWHSDNERGIAFLWTQKHFQDRLTALWAELARRYKDRAVIAGYNLINEPNSGNPYGEHVYDFYEYHKPDWVVFNGLCRRLVTEIRKEDPKHIIFMEGDNYSRTFDGMEEPFADNLVYSSHNYIAPGYGPGSYPGYYGSDYGQVYWDKNTQRNAFLNHQGTIFAAKHQVPLWVGEFGSQYHGPKGELPDRYRSMEDQLSVYNEYGAHWTTWTYKDPGVMGWVNLDPESEYMKVVEPIQKMKRNLGAENFVMVYEGASRGKQLSRVLADYILEEAGIQEWRASANAFVMNYVVLNGYAGAALQPAYVKRFKGMSEDDLERITGAFHIRNCIKNGPFIELLKTKIAD